MNEEKSLRFQKASKEMEEGIRNIELFFESVKKDEEIAYKFLKGDSWSENDKTQ